MSTSFDQCSLYLCPKQHDYALEDKNSFITALQKIDLVAEPINTKETKDSYYGGDKFLDYIAYMGCAPAIQFEASDDNDNFCFIKIHSYDSARLIVSNKQARAPHCPVCNKPVKDWQLTENDDAIICTLCNTNSGIEKFNWRKMAGYSQLFIEITDIFPKEAIPQQILLDRFKDITNVEWVYFYSCR